MDSLDRSDRFGAWVVAQRKKRNWTQNQLAFRIGVHPSQISRWERGGAEGRLPELGRFRDLVHAFGVDANIALMHVP